MANASIERVKNGAACPPLLLCVYINKRKDYLLGMFLHYTRVHCVATLCTTERRAKNRQLALAHF